MFHVTKLPLTSRVLTPLRKSLYNKQVDNHPSRFTAQEDYEPKTRTTVTEDGTTVTAHIYDHSVTTTNATVLGVAQKGTATTIVSEELKPRITIVTEASEGSETTTAISEGIEPTITIVTEVPHGSQTAATEDVVPKITIIGEGVIPTTITSVHEGVETITTINEVPSTTDNETSTINEPDFTTSPFAWALHRVADTIELGTTIATTSLTLGHAAARLGLSTASGVTQAILPSLNPQNEPLPQVVKDTLGGTYGIVKTGTKTIKDGISTVTSIGEIVGAEVGGAIKSTINVSLPQTPGLFLFCFAFYFLYFI
eukprot:TRINITY_DN2928_c0_g1_i1.p1 TRINITY_DN2928_c0_g1~~TRINITY_DN2928_c0_g1_i1.p1  ORF type:complete len:312 (+),score=41.52 TRINITY_DN2928_c0_g1_i1:26-961(+)